MPIASVYDRAQLIRILQVQHDVVSREQLLRCGMSDDALRHLLRKEQGWQILLPGVYLAYRGRVTNDQREMAALLYAGPESVITGQAALRRHGLACTDFDSVDVLIPAGSQRKSVRFVHILRTTRMPEKYRTEKRIRFAYLPRAIGDATRKMQDLRDVQALVSRAVQFGCAVTLLVKELNEGPVAGTRLFRAAVAEAAEGVRSSAEGDLKRLVDRSRIEKPLYNPELYLPDGTFLCSPDLWWERYGVAGEVDSRAYHFTAKEHEDTTKRHNRISRAGIHLLHWLPSIITREADSVLNDIRTTLASVAQATPPQIITVPAGQSPPAGCRPPGPAHPRSM
jgi:hypothetical protein